MDDAGSEVEADIVFRGPFESEDDVMSVETGNVYRYILGVSLDIEASGNIVSEVPGD